MCSELVPRGRVQYSLTLLIVVRGNRLLKALPHMVQNPIGKEVIAEETPARIGFLPVGGLIILNRVALV